jgi:beta-glucanase (GH16 family)
MQKDTWILLFVLGLIFSSFYPLKSQDSNKYVLVWSDEFDTEGAPNEENWSFDIGNGCPDLCDWGNNELQYYMAGSLENARVENGVLIIEAHKQEIMDKPFSSARLKSIPKGKWLYGKIEVKAKLPRGNGVWPAIWMLPVEGEYGAWPQSGEIDIMEHVGFNKDSVFGTVHTTNFNHKIGTQKGAAIYANNLSDVFHVYAVEWTQDKIDFFFNGLKYFTFNKISDHAADWPFDQPFYLILNLAVGGDWGGRHGVDFSIWPQRFEIDYVRVYQLQKN